jgi:hypothetical protein
MFFSSVKLARAFRKFSFSMLTKLKRSGVELGAVKVVPLPYSSDIPSVHRYIEMTRRFSERSDEHRRPS